MSRDLEPSSSQALTAPSARAPGRSISRRNPSDPTRHAAPSSPSTSSRSHHRTRSNASPTHRNPRVVRIRIRRNSSAPSSAGNSQSGSRTASVTTTPRMATATESIPDVAASETPDPRRASTAPTEESASGVGLPDHRQSYNQQQEDEDEEMQDQYHDEGRLEEMPPHSRHQNGVPAPAQAEATSPAAEYLMGIMAEFRKLEGKLASLLTEQARLKDENEELRNRPPAPDPATLQDLETLTTKYNKVKKLYFQKETQIEELNKENEELRADIEGLRANAEELETLRANAEELENLRANADELANLRNENTELNRDLDILAKERDQLEHELTSVSKERDSLGRLRESFERERESLLRERDALAQDRDAAEKEKEDALQDKQDATLERDDARQDRENLQNRVKDLEDEVAKLQAQNTAANGSRDKRVSAAPSGHASTGSDYPQEILKLKYDKVKRLYYEQQKTISHLEDRLRSAEAGRGDMEGEFFTMARPESLVSRSNSKGKQRASYVSPERDSYRGEGASTKSTSTDTPPQRRRSVRTSGRRGASLERDRMSTGTDEDVL